MIINQNHIKLGIASRNKIRKIFFQKRFFIEWTFLCCLICNIKYRNKNLNKKIKKEYTDIRFNLLAN